MTYPRTLIMGLMGGLLVVATACSDDASTDRDAGQDAQVSGEGGVGTDQGSDGTGSTGQVGDPCDKDGDCDSGICAAQACAKPCTSPADCETDQDCTTDDGSRLFCHTPAYTSDIGTSCALTGSCTGAAQRCLGGEGYAGAVCTDECESDMDCPMAYACRQLRDDKKYCIPRGFCSPCHHDDNCGGTRECVEHGGQSFCAQPCTQGSTECPQFATCADTGGGAFHCVHASGSCWGQGDLCDPCVADGQCASGAMCLTYVFSKESFCSSDCASQTCPTGYKCADLPTGPSTSVKQCVPDATAPDMPKCVDQLSPTMETGDIMTDFAMVGYRDANGNHSLADETLEVIKLSDVAQGAKLILFNVSAGWCGPCQLETNQFQGLMTTYGPQGLTIYQTLFDSDAQGQKPTIQLLDVWVSQLKADGAAGIDPGRSSVPYNTGGTTPLNMLIDAQTFEIVDKFNGFDLKTVQGKIETHLGITP